MNRTARRAARTALVVAGVFGTLAACGRGPATHYYLLEPRGQASSAAAGSAATVGVRAFHVEPPYDQDRIVYRVGLESSEIGFYAYHRWAAPLSRMVPRVVAGGLSEALDGASVEPAAPGLAYAAYLEGRISAFEEVDLPDGPRVRARMTLRLRGAGGAELWTREVSGEKGVQTDRVGDVVDALRTLLRELTLEAADAAWEEAVEGL